MSFKENILFLRKQAKMSQDELAEKLGYKSFTTIQKWEDGTSFPKVSNLNKLADIFNIEVDDLLYGDLVSDNKLVPIMGEVKAGYDLFADENIIGYEYNNYGDSNNGIYFYLKVKGDSMINDHIFNGSLVYVHKQDYLDKNDIGVFLINNSEVTIKHFKKNKDTITLIASNSRIKDRVYKLEDIKILGKVIHCKVVF